MVLFIVRLLILCTVLLAPTFEIKLDYFSKEKNIVIFVHGTILPGLALLNPYKSYTQSIAKEDWYARCMAKVRKDPLFQEDSLMLNEGLTKINTSTLGLYCQRTLPPELSKKGAYQTIGAYDTLSRLFNPTSNSDYYTFGFSGIFSATHRKEAAFNLYQHLHTLQHSYRLQGYETTITLCGYSHGGNVLLYLAEAENHEKKHLNIKNLILLGTPIQAETAHYAFHPLFSKIISLYSEGDGVQGQDQFSTPSGASYQTFREFFKIHNLPYHHKKPIFDIRLIAHESTIAFGHFNFWFLNQYNLPFFTTDSPEVKAIRNALSPLPLVVLIPALLHTLNQAQPLLSTLDLAIKASIDDCHLHLINPATKHTLCRSPNLLPTLTPLQTYARTSWLPYAQATETTRIAAGLRAALDTFSNS